VPHGGQERLAALLKEKGEKVGGGTGGDGEMEEGEALEELEGLSSPYVFVLGSRSQRAVRVLRDAPQLVPNKEVCEKGKGKKTRKR